MRRKIFLLKLNFWNDFHFYIKRGIVFIALSTLVNKIAIMLVIRQSNNRHLKKYKFCSLFLAFDRKRCPKSWFCPQMVCRAPVCCAGQNAQACSDMPLSCLVSITNTFKLWLLLFNQPTSLASFYFMCHFNYVQMPDLLALIMLVYKLIICIF